MGRFFYKRENVLCFSCCFDILFITCFRLYLSTDKIILLKFTTMEKQLDILIQTQHENSGWNFYNERQHVENLFYSRFNFFLVFYGMLIAAIATFLSTSTVMENPIMILGLLALGILILLFMQYTLCNVYHTLQIILTLIDGLPSYHSSPIISSLRDRGNTGILIAFYIPSFCIAFLYLILYYCMEDYCCGSALPFLLFLLPTTIIWLFNLCTAIRRISERKLRDVIGKAFQ